MCPPSRRVEPELLDDLPADDARAIASRRDLRRVHVAMRTVAHLRRAVAGLELRAPPKRVLELGAGDGTLLLRFARGMQPRWPGVELTLLDRLDLVSAQTRAAYARLGWHVIVARGDALEWAAGPQRRHYDVCFANLFLHHFDVGSLHELLRAVAAAADAFVACEPRRSLVALVGSRLIALLGANQVTRIDAVRSVAAGFAGHELAAAWGDPPGEWTMAEFSAWPFTHCLATVRRRTAEDRGDDGAV